MKTTEMAGMLQALAGLAASDEAAGLRAIASFFKEGKAETVASRIKKVRARAGAVPASADYPESLRATLSGVEAALTAATARKQADDVKAILTLFEGSPTGTVEGFVAWLSAPAAKTPKKAAGTAKAPRSRPSPEADAALAKALADELTRRVLDPEGFAEILEQLKDRKRVSTPTLGAVANLFLGNEKAYKGRKPVIDDIDRRHKEDVRFEMTGLALEKLGV